MLTLAAPEFDALTLTASPLWSWGGIPVVLVTIGNLGAANAAGEMTGSAQRTTRTRKGVMTEASHLLDGQAMSRL
ncbi:MAG: hypothetical protein KGL48_13850 [Sphingomonadales bacterium]|nr:hypothetical protein [Sphingomonadales bacterium]MDE2569268.1 hypothetical protein [Sphingomonadales bacterium]